MSEKPPIDLDELMENASGERLFQQGMEDYASNRYMEAAEAFRVAAYQQALADFRGEGKAAFIRPSALGKHDQRMLKAAFDSIQRLLELSAKIFENAA